MHNNLLAEYIIFQLLFIILAIYYWKNMLKLWKKDENNALGISSALGVVLGCILISILLYMTVFERKVSFLEEIINIYRELIS